MTRHKDPSEMEDELRIMVERGAKVINVVVEHPSTARSQAT